MSIQTAKREIKTHDKIGDMILIERQDSDFLAGVDRWRREFTSHPDDPNTVAYNRANLVRATDRRMNREFLKRILDVVARGHFNNEIRSLLIGIAEAEKATELHKIVSAMPDRTVCGVEESWVLAALTSFCRSEANSLMQFRIDGSACKWGLSDQEAVKIEAKRCSPLPPSPNPREVRHG
jgi:hypothetical protein